MSNLRTTQSLRASLLRVLTTLLLLSVALFSPLAAQDEKPKAFEEGPFQGQAILDLVQAQLTLNFDLEIDGAGSVSGAIYSVEQGNARIPVTKGSLQDGSLSLQAASVGLSFEGTVSEDQSRIEGTFTQGPVKHPLVIYKVKGFDEPSITETWKGNMDANGTAFEFRVRIVSVESGQQWVRLDSIGEGIKGLFGAVQREGDNLTFSIPSVKATFSGSLSDNGKTLTGKWEQNGGSFDLKLQQVENESETGPNRPQTPEEPFPYTSESVTFKSSDEGVTLAGTLTLPADDGPFPAVALISGSGPQDRDETLFDHKPFLVIADHLTRNGIAVLRYDDRGVGESTGDFASATSENFANDALAAVRFLREREDIDPDAVGLIGHSEGGMIAPMVAAETDEVAMLVLLAAPGVPGSTITTSQARKMAELSGATEDVLEGNDTFAKELLRHILDTGTAPSDDQIEAAFESAFGDKLPDETTREAVLQTARQGASRMQSAWFIFFARFDPVPVLKKVACPVLVLNGKKDVQVLCDLNVDAIQTALDAGGNKVYEIHKLDNLNHLFQTTDGNGLPNEYGLIEETFAPSALELITEWVLRVTGDE